MVKNPPANTGDSRDTGSIPGVGKFPGGGNDNLLQYSATVHGVAKSRTQMSTCACTHVSAELCSKYIGTVSAPKSSWVN